MERHHGTSRRGVIKKHLSAVWARRRRALFVLGSFSVIFLLKIKVLLSLLTIWFNYMVNNKDDSTEGRILTAAQKVFLKKGMAGARMQDIADEAGINKAMLHYYFRSKEKLFEKIFAELSHHFFPKLVMIFESDESVFTKIEMVVAEYIDQMEANALSPHFRSK